MADEQGRGSSVECGGLANVPSMASNLRWLTAAVVVALLMGVPRPAWADPFSPTNPYTDALLLVVGVLFILVKDVVQNVRARLRRRANRQRDQETFRKEREVMWWPGPR